MNDAIPATLPSRARVIAVTAGVVVFLASAGYVVGAAARRLTRDGLQLEPLLTIAVVLVLLGLAIADRRRT